MLTLWGNVDADAVGGGSSAPWGAAFPLNAAAETNEGIFVEDFPDPFQLSPLGKASS